MNRFEEITTALEQLNELESVDLVDLRKLMIEIEEFVNSEQYSDLSVEQRGQIQEARKTLRSRIRQSEPQDLGTMPGVGESSESPGDGRGQPAINANGQVQAEEVKRHDPLAEQQMEEAEKLFYSGRYAESIASCKPSPTGTGRNSIAPKRKITCGPAIFRQSHFRRTPHRLMERRNPQRGWGATPMP
jgi:hypothetical protein